VTRRSHRTSGTGRDYPRTARLNQLVHEIVAEEIERIDDERLGFLTVVGAEVESDLRHATVHYTTLGSGESDDDAPVVEALAEHRPRLQSAIGRQARLKRTPELAFRPDTLIRQAQRVEEILRDLATEEPSEPSQPGPASPAPPPATPADREG
jgi:ribosome-binding factor A